VIVLADSVYCCAEVIRAAHQRGFPVGGLVKKNRLLAAGRRAWDVPEEIAYDLSLRSSCIANEELLFAYQHWLIRVIRTLDNHVPLLYI
jgi:hypothetical protein